MINFKSVELMGATKEAAFEAAPFFIQGDATQAYKNWEKKQSGIITDAMKKDFYMEYLKKHSKFAPGIGYSITLQAAVADSRMRPYTLEDVKNKQGKRKYTTVYNLIDPATKSVVKTVNTTKADAKAEAKKLYTEKGYKGDLICTYQKEVTEGEPVAFKVKYTPSKNTRNGKYFVFGIEG